MNTVTRKAPPTDIRQLGNVQTLMLRSFCDAVDDWDEACSSLGAWEAQHLTKQNPRLALKQHQRTVNTLLSWGRILQQATRQTEFPDQVLPARIDARLRHLEDKLALWHRSMNPSEQDRILTAAFE